ncbi:hypothetical protein BH11PSE7_BH11PSE7_25320 [soil metagenome]
MIDEAQIQSLDPQQLREALRTLIAQAAGKDREIAFKQAFIDKLTHEMAVLKRLKFAAQSEAYSAEQKSLLDEAIDTDLAALAAEIEQTQPSPPAQDDKQKPKRQPLPRELATPRDPARARDHHLHLWLPDEAHWPRRGREAGLSAPLR